MAKVPVDFTVNAKGNAPTFFGKLEAQLKGLRKSDFAQSMDEFGKLLKGGGALAGVATTIGLMADYSERLRENMAGVNSEVERLHPKATALEKTIGDIPFLGKGIKWFNKDFLGNDDLDTDIEREKALQNYVTQTGKILEKNLELRRKLRSTEAGSPTDPLYVQQERFRAGSIGGFQSQISEARKQINDLEKIKDYMFHLWPGDEGRAAVRLVDFAQGKLRDQQALLRKSFEQLQDNNFQKIKEEADRFVEETVSSSLDFIQEARGAITEEIEKQQAVDLAVMTHRNQMADYFNNVTVAGAEMMQGMFNNQRSAGGLAGAVESRFGTGQGEAAYEQIAVEQQQLEVQQKMLDESKKLVAALSQLATKLIPAQVFGGFRM